MNLHDYNANARQLLLPRTAHSYRTISLNNRCIEILNVFLNECYDDFIFVNEKDRVFEKETLLYYFKRICAEKLGNNKEGIHYHLHMLRYSDIFLLVGRSMSIKIITERVGASNEKMILQVYSHLTKNMKDGLKNK